MFGQAEVRDARLVEGIEQHVRWFEVAVERAALVRILNGLGDKAHVLRRLGGGQRFFADERGQVLSLDIFHREVVLTIVLAHLVDGHDVGVMQIGRRLGLRQEALQRGGIGQLARQNHFYRHNAVETHLPGLVDHAHSASSDFLQQLVIAEVAKFGDGGFRISDFGLRTVWRRGDRWCRWLCVWVVKAAQEHALGAKPFGGITAHLRAALAANPGAAHKELFRT